MILHALRINILLISLAHGAADEIHSLSPAGVQLIARFEGFRGNVYTCPGGKPTIGFGHVIRPGETYEGVTLSRKEGLDLLNRDVVETYVPDVNRLVTVALSQGQFDALTSFDYNLGAKNLGSSTLLRLLNEGNYEGASCQFPLWRNAGGTPNQGLFKRRVGEMFIFRDSDVIPVDGLKVIPTKKTGETLLDVYQGLPQCLKDEASEIYTTYKAAFR